MRRTRFQSGSGLLAGVLLAAFVASGPVRALDAPASQKPGDLDSRQYELRGVEETIRNSEEQRRKLQIEAESLRNDRARLNAALIDTTTRLKSAESRVASIEERLATAQASESAINRSLQSRRGLVIEILAILQRMGHHPPPAVLVRPEDMLQAIRTSMLLGAVLPQMRAETEALASDLADLVQVRTTISNERESLAREIAGLGEESARLSALVVERQKAQGEAELALEAESSRSRSLARQAADLRDLIASMESEVAAAGRAADAARKADEARAKQPEGQVKVAMGPFRDPGRLTPALAFADTKGLLPLPVSGAQLRSFGAADDFGGNEKGISIATRPGAVVASPTDGWVSFSGPWRSYGQLLILNAGGGYYVVMAGMDRINVEVGQFVLAGEPVALMGDRSARTTTALAVGAAQPVLYVEFRKDGVAIDPGPWWAKPELEKARG